MYVLAVDLGSTNYKYLVLRLKAKNETDTDIELISKGRSKSLDFALFILDILKTYNIEKENVKCIVVTGTGSSFLSDEFEGMPIQKVDEFDAIAYGGLLLSKIDKGNIVSIGTGTTIIYSDMNVVKRIGGTGLGGGTLVGLGSAILGNTEAEKKEIVNFKTLVEMAKSGDRTRVDLMIGDINNGSINNMTPDITAANFAGIYKEANKNDYVAAVLNMILENIALIIKACGNREKTVYIGTLVSDEYVREIIKRIADYTGDEVIFVDDSEYAIVIGAWEYYLLRIIQ